MTEIVSIADVCQACQIGDLAQLKVWKAHGLLPNLMEHDKSYQYPHVRAAEFGHLEVLKWLVFDSGQQIDLAFAERNYATSRAAANGHLDVLMWLVNESGQSVDVTAGSNFALRYAAANGHLAVVRWLVEDSAQNVDVTDDDNFAIRAAIESGHLAVVKWLLENSVQAAKKNPALANLQLPPVAIPNITKNNADFQSVLCNVIQNDHFEMVKWLVEESRQTFDLTEDNNAAVKAAARRGNLKMLDWLIRSSRQQVDITADQSCALQDAALFGYLDVVKWIVEESERAMQQNPAWADKQIPKVDVTADDNLVFREAAGRGRLDVVRWLLCESGAAIDITANSNEALHEAIQYNYYEVVRSILCESGQLAEVIATGGIREEADLRLPEDLQVLSDRALRIFAFCEDLGIPVAERNAYLQSPACYLAIQSRLVKTVEELERVRCRGTASADRKRL